MGKLAEATQSHGRSHRSSRSERHLPGYTYVQVHFTFDTGLLLILRYLRAEDLGSYGSGGGGGGGGGGGRGRGGGTGDDDDDDVDVAADDDDDDGRWRGV